MADTYKAGISCVGKKYSDCKVTAQGEKVIDEKEFFEPIGKACLAIANDFRTAIVSSDKVIIIPDIAFLRFNLQ